MNDLSRFPPGVADHVTAFRTALAAAPSGEAVVRILRQYDPIWRAAELAAHFGEEQAAAYATVADLRLVQLLASLPGYVQALCERLPATAWDPSRTAIDDWACAQLGSARTYAELHGAGLGLTLTVLMQFGVLSPEGPTVTALHGAFTESAPPLLALHRPEALFLLAHHPAWGEEDLIALLTAHPAPLRRLGVQTVGRLLEHSSATPKVWRVALALPYASLVPITLPVRAIDTREVRDAVWRVLPDAEGEVDILVTRLLSRVADPDEARQAWRAAALAAPDTALDLLVHHHGQHTDALTRADLVPLLAHATDGGNKLALLRWLARRARKSRPDRRSR